MILCRIASLLVATIWLGAWLSSAVAGDHVRELQVKARAEGRAGWGHWGGNPEKYSGWTNHSNRLIPVYTFGMTLEGVNGERSAYRNESRLRALYGRVPPGTLNPAAEYFDQTAIHNLMQAGFEAGKKHIILVVFDGMDWQTTWAAAVHRLVRVGYREGRGTGLAFQDYAGTVTDFGHFVTSPHNNLTAYDVDAQTVVNPGGVVLGGYDAMRGGAAPWSAGDAAYLIGLAPGRLHAVTDSAASATSLTAGLKTYSAAINVDPFGRQVMPIARRLQERGLSVGVVTSVPISHATPAAAYANNVSRDDYQDLTRDLVGRPSIAHAEPLPGVDVLIGAGWGKDAAEDAGQGANYVPGNRYLARPDRGAIDVGGGGRYLACERTPGLSGKAVLDAAAASAVEQKVRLFGLFGVVAGPRDDGHLPFQTADRRYDPAPGVRPAEQYSEADIVENPRLADMTAAALAVLEHDPEGFWLMVEAGDVDWANHDNNLDNSIGAVLSGDEAFQTITAWAEKHNCWDETLVIVTADHGHYLVLRKPEALVP